MLIKKELFHSGIIGVFIGLAISLIISYLVSPSYLPLSPHSSIGLFFLKHHVHPSIMILYCLLIWFLIGILFGLGKPIFHKEWSLLRASFTHYSLMILGFLPLSTLAGWIPWNLWYILSIILEFSIIYLVIWCTMYHINKKKVEQLNHYLKKNK